MNLPTQENIKALHKKYAPSEVAFRSVWPHCAIVAEMAEEIGKKLSNIDLELVKVGALLHDIGVYKLYDGEVLDTSNYITHGILGYKLLKDEGFDDHICNFPLLHIGVGITKDDIKAQKLTLPLRDYLPETEEQRIVMFADKFHSKGKLLTFNTAEWYRRHLIEKFGGQKVAVFNELIKKFGQPDIEKLAKKYAQPIR